MPGTPERLVLTTPRHSLWIAIVGCGLGLALGVRVIGFTDDGFMKAWSWIGVLFLAGGVIAGLLHLRRPAQLILTPDSFALTGLIPVGPVPWADVESFFVYAEEPDMDGHGGVPAHASWRLKPGSVHAQGLVSRLNRAGDMGIDGSLPRNIGMAPEPLAELMEDWRVRYG